MLAEGTDHGTRETREIIKSKLCSDHENASSQKMLTNRSLAISHLSQGRDDLPATTIERLEGAKAKVDCGRL